MQLRVRTQWRQKKLTSILDAEDCWDIVNGTEFEPVRLATVNDVDGVQENKPQVDARLAEIKGEISGEESYLEIKLRYNELIRKIIEE